MQKRTAFLLYLWMICPFFVMTATAAAQAPVPLGTAAPFAALAGSGITNTGSTTITGDVGSHPTTTQTGFASITLIGTNHGGDATTQQAKTALRSAFLDAAGRLGPTLVAGGALGGQVLTPGVYKDNGAPASLGLTGILRLDAQGDPNAVFIFQSGSTLITEVGSSVVLLNGAQACNVFWQVGSAATLKTSTIFVGTILANDDISLQAGTTVAGRLLAGAQVGGAGALTLINNSITTPVCAAVPVPTADLTLSKSHSGTFDQGQVGAVYTLGVRNVGLAPTGGIVTVNETLPAGLTATSMSGTGWSCTLISLSCTRNDSLAAGGNYPAITVTVDVAGNAPNTLLNTATVSGGGDLNIGNNTATDVTTIVQAIVQFPDLTITKHHSGNFREGGSGVFTLTVGNIGQVSTSGTVTARDSLPAGLTATAIYGTDWNCSLSSLSCTRGDSLAANDTYPPVTVTVSVDDNPLGNRVGDELTFQRGDILISLADGTVQWRRRGWALVKIIRGVTDGQAKGMAFDALGNLFVTHYFGTGLSGNGVVKFDRTGNLIGLFGSGYDCNPSSMVFDRAGNSFVGHADCSGDILKLDSQGNRVAQYNVAVENRGSSHVLLDPDQCTLYYTSQGPHVKRFNSCTYTQMSDFNSTPFPDAIGGGHEFTLLPGGGMLVANFAVIARLDASGNLVRTYDAPAASHCWLGIALDPDGTSFWGTNWCDSSATRFDITTGNAIESHVASSTGFMAKQIIVAGPEQQDVVAPPGLRSTVVINEAIVSGSHEVNTENNSASDPTTILVPRAPALSMNSGAYCVGDTWRLGITDARPNTSIRLAGTTNGQAWVMPGWGTSDDNGSFTQEGTYTEGTQGRYTLTVDIAGKTSNTVSVVISDCRL